MFDKLVCVITHPLTWFAQLLPSITDTFILSHAAALNGPAITLSAASAPKWSTHCSLAAGCALLRHFILGDDFWIVFEGSFGEVSQPDDGRVMVEARMPMLV